MVHFYHDLQHSFTLIKRFSCLSNSGYLLITMITVSLMYFEIFYVFSFFVPMHENKCFCISFCISFLMVMDWYGISLCIIMFLKL